LAAILISWWNRSEPIGTQRGGQFRPEHLDCHLPLVLEVFSEIDSCHPTCTELPLYTVPVGDVLKNPAETSMYGVRGANGVIVITTKRSR
jgi:TonB-dependent SusC/RagA subfamily outer membrane receptor